MDSSFEVIIEVLDARNPSNMSLLKFLKQNYNIQYGYAKRNFNTFDEIEQFAHQMSYNLADYLGTNITIAYQFSGAYYKNLGDYVFYTRPRIFLNLILRINFI